MYTYQNKAFPFNYAALETNLTVCGQQSQRPALRPWQYVVMEYQRVGLPAPMEIPNFESFEDADIWMCLDMRYNRRLRELSGRYSYQTAG